MLERLFPQQADDKLFVEDCFSCFLYTGDGSTQTITNGIDLAGKGGMLWRKSRGFSGNHVILDTVRGIASYLESNTTSAAGTGYNWIASFNSDGFTNNNNSVNNGPSVSWTFRKAPNFFDVVTYTGDGTDNRQISHNLGVAPGFIVVKSTSSSNGWACWHRGNGTTNYNLRLNSTGEGYTPTNIGGFPVAASSTTFTVRNGVNGWDGVNYSANDTGQTYVAYLFAHNTASDGFIQCGSFDGAANTNITLGWEPQWIMFKNTTGASNWQIVDNMRGMPVGSDDRQLMANLANAESDNGLCSPTATGFTWVPSAAGNTYIYMAIRRGPMRTPTLGTSVFQAITDQGDLVETSTATFPLDMQFNTFYDQSSSTYNNQINDRLRGIGFSPTFNATPHLTTASTDAETTSNSYLAFKGNGMDVTKSDGWGTWKAIFYNFRRAPGFMDVVCYTGNGNQNLVVNHSLGVAPEMVITKKRTGSNRNWGVYTAFVGTAKKLRINTIEAVINDSFFFPATPTSTVLNQGNADETNEGGSTYVAYLFASVPGVSKVGTYTGNGSSQTINCAFTTGARFVLIKRTDSTGDWWVWDTARGIVSANDPALRLNSTAAETTGIDSVDPDSTGFVVNQDATTNINVNGASYIFLSIA